MNKYFIFTQSKTTYYHFNSFKNHFQEFVKIFFMLNVKSSSKKNICNSLISFFYKFQAVLLMPSFWIWEFYINFDLGIVKIS